jgi:hypothetical protein
MENFSFNENTSIEKHMIKTSFDKLIKLFYPENRIKHKEDTTMENNNQKKKQNQKINNKSKNLKNVRQLENKSFLNQNFCNEECQLKFQKILMKVKNGEIDVNKINWSQKDGQDFNLIQNLVNYYYNAGYNQAASPSHLENKNN